MKKKSVFIACINASLIMALEGFFLSASPALASGELPQLEQSVERFGVGINGGLNNIGLPFLGAVISYRTPLFDDTFTVVGQYDLNFNEITPITQAAWLGIHQDFYTNPAFMNTRIYSRLMLGGITLFNPGQPGPNNTTIWKDVWIPAVQIGMGAEAQIAGPLWGVVQVSSGFPLLLRTELGMRVSF